MISSFSGLLNENQNTYAPCPTSLFLASNIHKLSLKMLQCANENYWVGGRLKRQGIHIVVWPKPIQHCKEIILQLKN